MARVGYVGRLHASSLLLLGAVLSGCASPPVARPVGCPLAPRAPRPTQAPRQLAPSAPVELSDHQAAQESTPALVAVLPFVAGDAAAAEAEVHEIARGLLVTALAATKKFAFTATEAGAALVVHGTVARPDEGTYALTLRLVREGEAEQLLPLAPRQSLEQVVEEAAAEVAATQQRNGYIIKRDGARLVIARGTAHGVAVGQRYRTGGGEEFVITRVDRQTAEGEIARPRVAGALAVEGLAAMVDVVFVIDTTGSMGEEIDGVVQNCQRFAGRLALKGIDARLGLVTFGVGVDAVSAPTADVDLFRRWVADLDAGGGGHETPFAALEAALALPFRPGAVPVFILITDEPAWDAMAEAGVCSPTVGPAKYFAAGIGARVLAGVRALSGAVVAVTLDDRQCIYPYLAVETGGSYFDLETNQDFTVLLDAVGAEIEGRFVDAGPATR